MSGPEVSSGNTQYIGNMGGGGGGGGGAPATFQTESKRNRRMNG